MDKLEIYKNIKTIADELCKENKTYLRADLAFELKKYGIASDCSEVRWLRSTTRVLIFVKCSSVSIWLVVRRSASRQWS